MLSFTIYFCLTSLGPTWQPLFCSACRITHQIWSQPALPSGMDSKTILCMVNTSPTFPYFDLVIFFVNQTSPVMLHAWKIFCDNATVKLYYLFCIEFSLSTTVVTLTQYILNIPVFHHEKTHIHKKFPRLKKSPTLRTIPNWVKLQF